MIKSSMIKTGHNKYNKLEIRCKTFLVCLLILSGLFVLDGARIFAANENYYEKIYLQTDRDYYISGEDTYFKVYLVAGGEAEVKSSIVYVELDDAHFNPIVKTTLKLSNNSVSGTINLPDSLSSGTYILKAYTNWLRNFGHEYIFMKPIDIINRFGKFNEKNLPKTDEVKQKQHMKNSANLLVNAKNDSVYISLPNFTKFQDNKPVQWRYFYQGEELKKVQTFVDANPASKIIERKSLPQGVVKVEAWQNKSLVASDFIYNKSDDTLLHVSFDKPVYKKRDKVELTLNLKNPDSLANVNLSISVVAHVPERRENNSLSVVDWMNCFSEMGNTGYFPDFKTSKSDTIEEVHGNWLFDRTKNSTSLIYPAEHGGHLITGKVISKTDNQPVNNALVYLSLINSNAYLNYDYTDSAGRFYFFLPEIYDKGKIVVQVWNAPEDREACVLKLDESVKNGLNSSDYLTLMPADYYSEVYSNQVKAFEINSVFNKNKTLSMLQTLDSSDFVNNYLGLSKTVYPKDFIKLNNFAEISQEILPGVKFRDEGSSYSIRILNEKQNDYFSDEPLVLVNGLPIKDYSPIAMLNSDDIKKIDIVQQYFIVGRIINQGLLSVQLSNPAGFKIASADYMKFLSLNTNNENIFLKFPHYDNKEDRLNHKPDFRNTLFWQPSIIFNNKGTAKISFYTSDISGTFDVIIQGLLKNNTPVCVYSKIFVDDEY